MKSCHELVISSWNINRGLLKKQSQIEEYLHDHNIDILALQETDLKYYDDKSPFIIPGFVTFSNLVKSIDSKTRLLIIAKENLKLSLRNDLMSNNFCSIWLEVMAKKRVIIGAFYREWNDGSNDKSIPHQQENLNVFLNQIESAANVKTKAVVVLGDMNIDLNKVKNHNYPLRTLYQNLESCLAEQGLVNIEVGDTYTASRSRKDGTTITSALDHLYISDLSILKQCEAINNGMSDHNPIKAILQLRDFDERSELLIKRSFKNFDQASFNQDLASQGWEDLGRTEDVNIMTRMFTNFFIATLNIHAPYKKVWQCRRKRKIKLSQNCLQLMMERDALAKAMKLSSKVNSKDLAQYKVLRNRVTKLTRKEKKENIALEIERNPTSQNIWRIINNHIANKKSPTIKIEEDGKEVSSNQETAEIFNHYFHDKIKGLRERINNEFKRDPFSKMDKKMEGKHNLSFKFKTVSEAKVLKIINQIKPKRSCGYDEITADMLKKVANIIYIPITYIINASITSGVFPEEWKLAIVKPLHKKGKKCDKANYRPISLLSSPSMILERVVRSQIVKYMEDNGLFGANQFGFRANKSTVGALLSMFSACQKNADKGNYSAIALYDLSAAFDCLDVEILCGKMKKLGFDSLAIKWVQSYLTGRQQKVMVGDSLSTKINLPFGSPQGSCLSPCLFIILISDIELWVQDSSLFGYCDDTSGVTFGKSEKDAVQLLEKDAINFLEYMASNKLVINPSKTCVMINSRDSSRTISSVCIGDQAVQVETNGKLLGLDISEDLAWNYHVDELAKVINQRLSIIKRLREVIMPAQLIKVGEALVNSKIRYGISAYGSIRISEDDPKNGHMIRIQVLQNSLMRLILGKRKSECISVESLLELTKFQSINRMAVYHTAQEMFSIVHRDSIPSLSDYAIRQTNVCHNTRQNDQDLLRLPLFKYKRNQGFIYKGIKLWNALPNELRKIQKKDLFSAKVKNWIASNIPI